MSEHDCSKCPYKRLCEEIEIKDLSCEDIRCESDQDNPRPVRIGVSPPMLKGDEMRNRRWDMKCPKCGQTVYYWPNCSENTARDCNNKVWVLRKDGVKQFMHIRCPHHTK